MGRPLPNRLPAIYRCGVHYSCAMGSGMRQQSLQPARWCALAAPALEPDPVAHSGVALLLQFCLPPTCPPPQLLQHSVL